jgi:hypothetical protein
MWWLQDGAKTTETAARLGCIPSTIFKKLPPNSLLPAAKSRSGRPMKSSARENKRLKDYAVRFPFKTARELKKEVPGWDNLHTAERTELVLPLCC